MTTEADARNAAIERYKIVAGLLGLLSVGLLIIGFISALKYPDNGRSPPYFIGGFTAGFLGLRQALMCTCIVVKGLYSQEDEIKKRELVCVMTGQNIVAMFQFMGCFIGVVMAGVGVFGFSTSIFEKEVPHRDTIKGLAVAIIVGCILELAVSIWGICIICTYGSYFGVQMNRNRGPVIMVNQPNGTGTATVITNTGGGFGSNDTYMFTTGGGFNTPGTTNANVQALQEENRLLQEQLRLQRDLNQQRNQPFGFQGQPSPPSYGFYGSMNNPSVPPPSYNKAF
ncbi:uncharacterized protein LOC127855836 isoform X2 [Dreissena polymorpha]|uniref:uncharacterized protein LOC127855836 isoform X2 n=1 Tax=Dreissena polymorpha TaxID=45954 RepID=UPI0022645113|nr:uncharacterized protein LOC127855836 isoform X2 [Dreissena polymorpha]